MSFIGRNWMQEYDDRPVGRPIHDDSCDNNYGNENIIFEDEHNISYPIFDGSESDEFEVDDFSFKPI